MEPNAVKPAIQIRNEAHDVSDGCTRPHTETWDLESGRALHPATAALNGLGSSGVYFSSHGQPFNSCPCSNQSPAESMKY